MNKDNPGLPVLKKIALYGLLPVVLILMALGGKVVKKSQEIKARWTLVEAVVTDADKRETMTLEWPWNGRVQRLEVRKPGGRTSFDQGQKVLYYVNPANLKEVHQAGFDNLWSGPIVIAVFVGLLSGVAGLLWWLGGKPMLDTPEAFIAQAEAHHAAAPEPASPPVDDQSVIEMREPAESWKANVFWGLLLGLLLIVPSCFAEAGNPGWKKYGSIFGGLVWMAVMGRSALQNRGRTIRCDDQSIVISQPFGSRTVPLYQVSKLTREDVRKKFREVEEFGLSRREKASRLNTLGTIVVFNLYDAKGGSLLRLDSHMQPSAELQRFLRRMEKLTGRPVEDE